MNYLTETTVYERSGARKTANPWVGLLYLLLRDEITPGKLEEYVQMIEKMKYPAEMSNGWLGDYALDIFYRITKQNYVPENYVKDEKNDKNR